MTYQKQGVVPFVVALCSVECPTSGEVYTSSVYRAARETLATFPGFKSETPEGFLNHWNKIMGKEDIPYLPKDALDHTKYIVRQALGVEMQDVGEFAMGGR